jgi:hypothetical protein
MKRSTPSNGSKPFGLLINANENDHEAGLNLRNYFVHENGKCIER